MSDSNKRPFIRRSDLFLEDDSELVIEDLEKAFSAQLDVAIKNFERATELARSIEKQLHAHQIAHQVEREISDELEKILGKDEYIDVFFTKKEILTLEQIQRANSLKSTDKNKKISRRGIQVARAGRDYDSYYDHYKYKSRIMSLDKKRAEELLASDDVCKSIKKFILFNLDELDSKKYAHFNYKLFVYKSLKKYEN